jgi:hypothetical protein
VVHPELATSPRNLSWNTKAAPAGGVGAKDVTATNTQLTAVTRAQRMTALPLWADFGLLTPGRVKQFG